MPKLPVFIAYIDDSGTDANSPIQVVGAVLVKDSEFQNLEVNLAVILSDLLPETALPQFEEFKATDLYHNKQIFGEVSPDACTAAFGQILQLVSDCTLAVVYGAVDKQKHRNTRYKTANPLDVAFCTCIEGIQSWMKEKANNDLCILVADDDESSLKVKAAFKETFRSLRQRMRPPDFSSGKLDCIHDAIYFGDSKDSIGIQIADICSFVIRKHLENPVAVEGFYRLLEPRIYAGTVHPVDGL